MAIFKAPRVSTLDRLNLILEVSEIVYDVNLNLFFGGDGSTSGGFPLGKGSSPNTYIIQLTQENIDSKNIVLPATPFYPNNVSLTPEGGIIQRNSIDYNIVDNILSWNGLGLDGYLEVGETIIVQF